MERDDFLKDEFLSEFMKKLPEESPSDHFVSNVMREILPAAEPVAVRQSWALYIKSTWPYALITLAVLAFFLTSDLPFGDALPGKGFFTNYINPYLSLLAGSFRTITDKAGDLTLPLMIAAAAILFFAIDKVFSVKIHHQPTN